MNDDLNMLAAEYVLGTLDSAGRADFERRLATDEEAKRAVQDWSVRLSPLAGVVEEIAPPSSLWDKIEKQIQRQGRPAAGQPPAAFPANDNLANDLRRTAAAWRRAFIAASALAASLVLLVAYREFPVRREPASIYVAAVNRGSGGPALVVTADPASKTALVIPVAVEIPPGRSLELWFIGSGEKPKSMGLIKPQTERLALPMGVRIEKASLAVSVEPEGGSPRGEPTGPVVYSGQLIKG
jgi:anti-sigma-K factor RskA